MTPRSHVPIFQISNYATAITSQIQTVPLTPTPLSPPLCCPHLSHSQTLETTGLFFCPFGFAFSI